MCAATNYPKDAGSDTFPNYIDISLQATQAYRVAPITNLTWPSVFAALFLYRVAGRLLLKTVTRP